MKPLKFATLLIFLSLPILAQAENAKVPMEEGGSWVELDLKSDVVGDAEILDGTAIFDVDLPVRAEDAANVPVRIIQKDDQKIEELQIIIDENPSPVAAIFTFSEAMEPLDFETRIRVNQYSNVRVLAKIDGQYYMNGHYVKASGGCSAPATKDPETALKEMGKMRLRGFEGQSNEASSTPIKEAQLQIRHPNYSGLQKDQVTQLFVPAMFIQKLEIRQGEDMLFTMEGGISISENPAFRFKYKDNGSTNIHVNAQDTDGHGFEEEFDKVELSAS